MWTVQLYNVLANFGAVGGHLVGGHLVGGNLCIPKTKHAQR